MASDILKTTVAYLNYVYYYIWSFNMDTISNSKALAIMADTCLKM